MQFLHAESVSIYRLLNGMHMLVCFAFIVFGSLLYTMLPIMFTIYISLPLVTALASPNSLFGRVCQVGQHPAKCEAHEPSQPGTARERPQPEIMGNSVERPCVPSFEFA